MVTSSVSAGAADPHNYNNSETNGSPHRRSLPSNSQQLSQSQQQNYKFILVGNSRVGKTSLTNRCVFDEFEDDEATTRICQVVPMPCFNVKDDQWVQAHIWDTLGQEKFHSLAPLFFRRSVGAFLVYDVTCLESFKAIDKWHQQILKNTASQVIVMLIGNKKDKLRRQVPYKMAAEFAQSKNFGFMEISAKTGSGVKEAFERLITEVYLSLNEEHYKDPDQPQLVPTSRMASWNQENEVFKNSLQLEQERHFPNSRTKDSRGSMGLISNSDALQQQLEGSDNFSYNNSKTSRRGTKSSKMKSKCCKQQ